MPLRPRRSTSASRATDRGLRAARRHPHRRARRLRRFHRLDVRAPLRRRSRSSGASSAARTPARSAMGPAATPPVVARRYRPEHRHPRDHVERRRRPTDADRRDGRRGRRPPAAVHPARSPAHRRGRPGRGGHRLRPPPRRAPPAAARRATAATTWSAAGGRPLAVSLASPPVPHRARAADDGHRRPGPAAHDRRSPSPTASRSSTSTPTPPGPRSRPTSERWRAWCDDIDDELPHRDAGRPQPAHPASADLLAVGRAGRGTHHVAARAPRRDPQLGLPLRLAPRRQHRHRRLPRRSARRDEARRFLAWLLHASRLDRPGSRSCSPSTAATRARRTRAAGWPGYADSPPVRIGNGAADQHQLDGYGWVLDAAWLLDRRRPPPLLRDLAGHARLRRRSRRALERARRRHLGDPRRRRPPRALQAHGLARPRPGARASPPPIALPPGSEPRWQTAARRHRRPTSRRPRLRPERSAATPARYGSTDLDAAAARAPAARPRAHGLATRAAAPSTPSPDELDAGGPLLYRYPPGQDGLPGTRRRVPALLLLAGPGARRHRPRRRGRPSASTSSLALASPLGLYAEEMDPVTHAHLGNYPQALTHAALVQAALALRVS